jgi:superfamily II DNA/RNA helicase
VLALLGRHGEISGLRAGHIQTLSNLEDLEVTTSELEDVNILVTTPLKFCNLSILGYDMQRFKQIIFDEADKYFELSFMK